MSKSILNLSIVRGTTFGPVQIYCKDSTGAPVPLAGWSAYAQARDSTKTPVIIDFAPVIAANDSEGLVTLPAIPWATTKEYSFQSIEWDLILQKPSGERLPPFIGGAVNISTPTTQP
jgi:hypothetical protein